MIKYAFQCPRCHSPFIGVCATVFLEILQTPDGEWETETASDYEYDRNSPGTCLDCDYQDRMRYFHTQDAGRCT